MLLCASSKINKKTILGFILIVLLSFDYFFSNVQAMQTISESKPNIHHKLKYHHFVLENGMEVYLIPDHRSPIVSHMVWYRVGSADEIRGKSGLAHFFEHLMFKGTDRVPSGEFSKIIAKNGGNDNAFTSSDYTAYYQRIAKDRLEIVMDMEADRMLNLKLTDEDIETERKVIFEERRQRVENNPSSELVVQMNSLFYLNHPYRRPVIGWHEDIEGLTREDILSFYKQYYSPNNAILVVAGDVRLEELKPLAEKYYGVLENRNEPLDRIRDNEPVQDVEKRIVMRDAKVSLPTFQRFYHSISARNSIDLESEALSILSYILGGSTTSVLYQKLVVEAKLAASVGAYYRGTLRDHGVFIFYGIPNAGIDVLEIEEAIDTAVVEFLENGINEEIIEKAKTSLISSEVYSYDDHFVLARAIGSIIASDNEVDRFVNWSENIAKVKKNDILRVAKKYLKAEGSITGILLPIKEEPPQPIISEDSKKAQDKKNLAVDVKEDKKKSSDADNNKENATNIDNSENSDKQEVKDITIQEQEVKQEDETNN